MRSNTIKIRFLSTSKLQIYKNQASNQDPLHQITPSVA